MDGFAKNVSRKGFLGALAGAALAAIGARAAATPGDAAAQNCQASRLGSVGIDGNNARCCWWASCHDAFAGRWHRCWRCRLFVNPSC